MPTGPGGLDANGVWQYGEDDTEALASDLLNLGMGSVSTVVGGLGAPTILQVVSTTKTDTFTSATSSAWVDVTGLSATITPSSASSKILAFVSVDATGTLGYAFFGQLLRDSTPIGIGDADSLRTRASFQNTSAAGTSNNHHGPFAYSFLDTPASTSALVYKFQVQVQGGGSIYVNRNETSADNLWISRTASTITLMEVAG